MEDKEKIIDWLKKLPPDDPRGYKSGENFSYEDWFEKGRSFPNVIPVLIEMLSQQDINTPDALTFPAIYALGWIGNLSAADVLAKFMRSNNNFIRYESIASLGRLKAFNYFDDIRKLLEDKAQTANVRANACIALGNMSHPGSSAVLKKFLSDQDPFVARCAKAALELLK